MRYGVLTILSGFGAVLSGFGAVLIGLGAVLIRYRAILMPLLVLLVRPPRPIRRRLRLFGGPLLTGYAWLLSISRRLIMG